MKKTIMLLILLSVITMFTNGCMLPFFGNEAPVIQSNPPETVKLGSIYSYQVEAIDDNNTDLKYSLTVYPEGMTINPSTGVISWTPTENQLGENEVSIKVSDGWMSSNQDFTVEVKNLVLSSISINPNSMEITKPGTKLIGVITAHYDDGTSSTISKDECTFESTNTSIATVNSYGQVSTGSSTGTTAITVTYTENEISASNYVSVTVKNPTYTGGWGAN